MICPIITQGKLTEADCVKENCAWWDATSEGCAVRMLAALSRTGYSKTGGLKMTRKQATIYVGKADQDANSPPEKPESDKELADKLRALWIERADGAEPFMGGED